MKRRDEAPSPPPTKLTLEDFKVPIKPRYLIAHLAQYLGGSVRAWQREVQLGNLRAVKLPGGWAIPRPELERYFKENQFFVNDN